MANGGIRKREREALQRFAKSLSREGGKKRTTLEGFPQETKESPTVLFGKALSDPRLTEGERRGALRRFISIGGHDLGFTPDQPLPPKPKKRKRRFGPE